jgi:hypothetical protein
VWRHYNISSTNNNKPIATHPIPVRYVRLLLIFGLKTLATPSAFKDMADVENRANKNGYLANNDVNCKFPSKMTSKCPSRLGNVQVIMAIGYEHNVPAKIDY